MEPLEAFKLDLSRKLIIIHIRKISIAIASSDIRYNYHIRANVGLDSQKKIILCSVAGLSLFLFNKSFIFIYILFPC